MITLNSWRLLMAKFDFVLFFFPFSLYLFCCFYFPLDNIANVHFMKRRVILHVDVS
jgi:hypothetical protein